MEVENVVIIVSIVIIIGLLGVVIRLLRVVVNLKQVVEHWKAQAVTDALTGLPNRGYFDLRLASACSLLPSKLEEKRLAGSRTLGSLTLFIFDLDRFKFVNDTYGHQVGDVVLKEAAQVIKSCLQRSSDIACRYGGEEFAVILPDISDRDAVALAIKINKAVAKLDFSDRRLPKDFRVTVSGGLARAGCNEETDFLFQEADNELLRAKETGRNCVFFKGEKQQ